MSEKLYKFDMHCHTREGSLDARIRLIDYARLLKAQGFAGMLVTDHDSYDGYRTWLEMVPKPKDLKNFVILKGVEYDSRDGGHVLVVLPDGVECPILEIQGLRLQKLAEIVHKLGGIMGAAHPYGNGYFAVTNTRLYRKHPEIMELFDFIEVYNTGFRLWCNQMANRLARKLGKPGTCGSDSHSTERVGSGYTAFSTPIRCNNDLIREIRANRIARIGASRTRKAFARENPVVRRLGIWGYWVYNKLEAVSHASAIQSLLERKHLWDRHEDTEEERK